MSRTLTTNAESWYLRQGARPRVFLSIPGAGKLWSTDESGSFVDKIESIGRITNRIDPFGGMSVVSDCQVTIAKDGDANAETFFTSAVLSPHDEGVIKGAGRLLRTGGAGESYFYIRSATSGSLASEALVIGQRYNPGTIQHNVYRTYVQYDLSSLAIPLTTCEDAFLRLTGVNDESDTDFDLHVYEGNWPSLSNSIFNKFDGWIAGAPDYTGTRLNELIGTSDFISGENFIRFNRAGREAIDASAGGTLTLMILSSRDATYETPTGDEYVRFERSDALNTPTLELQYNTMSLDNERATIYLAFKENDGTLATSVTGKQAIWSGVVEKYEIEPERLVLKLRHDDFKRNQLIPLDVITTDDFPNCPEDNIGKPYPVVYGNVWQGSRTHKIGIGSEYSGAAINPLSGVRDYFPFPVVDYGDFDHDEPMQILIGSTALKDTINGFPAFYSSGMKGFSRLWVNISSDKDNGYSYIEATPKAHPNQSNSDVYPTEPNAYNLDFFGEATSIIPSSVYSSVDVTDPENAFASTGTTILSESTSWVQYAFPSIGSAGEINKVEISFYLVDNNTDPLNDLTVKVVEKPSQSLGIERSDGATTNFDGTTSNFQSAGADFSSLGVAANDMLVITSGDNEGRYRIKSVVDANNIRTETQPDEVETGQTFRILNAGATLKTVASVYNTGTRIINITALDSGNMDWDLASKLIQIEVSAGAAVLDYEIYCLQVRYFSTHERITTIYLDSKGRKDGSGNLIEIASKVIKAVAENESPLTESDINTTSFTSADTTLAAWIFAFSIYKEQENLFNYRQKKGVMDGLGKQCKSSIFWDADGKLKINPFSATDYFPNSGTNIPGNLDIVEYDGSPSGGSLTKNPIVPGSFKPLKQIPIDDVKNDIVLKYRKNYATGKYAEVLYIDNGDGVSGNVSTNITEAYLENSQTLTELKKKCADSYNEIHTTNTITIEAWAIRDEATATKLLQAYIEWFTVRRWTAEFMTKRNALKWSLGDFKNIRFPDVYTQFGDAKTERMKWKLIEIDPDLMRMQWFIKAIQVN